MEIATVIPQVGPVIVAAKAKDTHVIISILVGIHSSTFERAFMPFPSFPKLI